MKRTDIVKNFKIDYNGKYARALGVDTYKAVLSRHKLFTQKATLGKVKACLAELETLYKINSLKETNTNEST